MFISFYDTMPGEQQRFIELLAETDFQYEFKSEPCSLGNSNPDAEIISIFSPSKMTRDVLEKFPKLKLIATRSTGFDHIDLVTTQERGITVVNVPKYGEETVAEYAFMLLLALSRKLLPTAEQIESGNVDISLLQGFDLAGKTIGIIGTGKIGQHVIRIAQAFGMEVIAYDAYPNDTVAKEFAFTYVSLEELATRSDVISLHAPGTAETHHLINEQLLSKMKLTAVLINTARGSLVDTSALVKALGARKLAGAALDVVEHEELLHGLAAPRAATEEVDNDKAQAILDLLSLKTMPQVILTPHNAFNTIEAVDRIRQTTVQNIIEFTNGTPTNIAKDRS